MDLHSESLTSPPPDLEELVRLYRRVRTVLRALDADGGAPANESLSRSCRPGDDPGVSPEQVRTMARTARRLVQRTGGKGSLLRSPMERDRELSPRALRAVCEALEDVLHSAGVQPLGPAWASVDDAEYIDLAAAGHPDKASDE